VGRATVPAIASVVEATGRSLASMAGTAARPLLSNCKNKSFRHHTPSENSNKSQAPILRLEIQASKISSYAGDQRLLFAGHDEAPFDSARVGDAARLSRGGLVT